MTIAIDMYDEHQRGRGNAELTIATTRRRLEAVLADFLDKPIQDLTPARAERFFTAWATKDTRFGAPPAADTRHNVLGQLKTFGRWAVKRKLMAREPFSDIEVLAPRQPGKEQVTIDELRQLATTCLAAADAGDDAAIAVLMVLYFGIRATEVVARTARDLDDGGRLLRVQRLKKRRVVIELLVVDDELRPYLERLASRGGDLFPGRTRDWVSYHCRRLCGVADVPVVGPQALRGSVSSGLVEVGAHMDAVQLLLGHENRRVTERHYVRSDVSARADQRARLQLVKGGRR